MLTLNTLTRYTPEYHALMPDALYLQTEDGLDWYCHLSRFSPETLKICFDAEGIIRSASTDASRLCPLGLSVTEVAESEIPGGFTADGTWLWDGAAIVAAPQVTEGAGRSKADILADLEALRAELEALPEE
ncbi:TPA: hypothetical protein NPN84_003709 [Klebsiella variicola subsp. variicola]|nr:hypothetical protein [Klebsiella variicola subsp. variicola]